MINFIQVCRIVQFAHSCAHVSFCAFYVVSTPLIPPGGGAAAAKSRAVRYARLRSAPSQRPYWPDTST